MTSSFAACVREVACQDPTPIFQSSDTEDSLKEIFQLFIGMPSGFSEAQINVLVVCLQYLLFSPFYIALSILGGAVAKWRPGSRKV